MPRRKISPRPHLESPMQTGPQSSRNSARRPLLSAIAIGSLCSAASAQSVWYVDDSAPVGGDGKGWSTAFRSINGGLDKALPGDEVRVAQGLYMPDGGPGRTRFDRDATIQIGNGVVVLGGFRGVSGGGPADERDPGRFHTTLSGDLRRNDPNVSDNSRHVVTFSTDVTATIDGCEISAGNDTSSDGVNVRVLGGHATLAGCTIAAGNAQDGGGILVDSGSLHLLGSLVVDCHASSGRGGGINAVDSDVTIEFSEFDFNTANDGGAFAHSGSGTVTLRDTRCFNNFANRGGAAVVEHGDFVRCVFDFNSAGIESSALRVVPAGGGGGAVTVIDSFLFNNAGPKGGAVHAATVGGGPIVTVLGGTVVANHVDGSSSSGGLQTDDPAAGALVVKNTILWDNDSGHVQNEKAQLSGPPGSIAIDYSDVEGWTGNLGGVGNLGASPHFVAPMFGDYRLLPDSPCVDTGDPAFVLTRGYEISLDGNVRLLDANFDRADLLDMGAFEFSNVALSMFGDPRPGGVITVRLDGTPGLPALLIVGTAEGFTPIPPLGAFLFDVFQPTEFVEWSSAPSMIDVDIPPDFEVPASFFVQAFVSSGSSGNLSNMIRVDIR